MNEYEILIKTKADLKAAQETRLELQRQIRAAKALGQDTAALEGKLARVNAALKGAGGDTLFSRVGQQVRGLGASLASFSAGALGAVTAGLSLFTAALMGADKAIREYAAAQERVAGLDAALAQRGQLTDDYRERLQQLAQTYQEVTGKADEEWIDVLTRLTQFGSGPETIERDAEAVKNLAGILGGDLQKSATAVARAMQGNFTTFARYGIVVDDAASQTEKLNKLYEELAQRGGGQLEARQKSLIGQWAGLRNAASDFLEAIGRLISGTGVLQKAMEWLTVAANAWTSVLGGIIPKVDGLTNANKRTTQSVDEARGASQRYTEELKKQQDRQQSLIAGVEREIASRRHLQALKDEVTDAQMAYDLAGVDIREQTGMISPEKAQRERSGIRSKAEEKKFREGQETIDFEIGKNREKITLNNKAMSDTAGAAEAADAKLQAAETAERRRAEMVEGYDSTIRDLQIQIAALDSKMSSGSLAEGVQNLRDREVLASRLQETQTTKEARLRRFDQRNPTVEQQLPEAQQAYNTAVETGKKHAQENVKTAAEIEALEQQKTANRRRFGLQRSEKAARDALEMQKVQAERREGGNQGRFAQEDARRTQMILTQEQIDYAMQKGGLGAARDLRDMRGAESAVLEGAEREIRPYEEMMRNASPQEVQRASIPAQVQRLNAENQRLAAEMSRILTANNGQQTALLQDLIAQARANARDIAQLRSQFNGSRIR